MDRRRGLSGGALCNTSADCGGNGACLSGTNLTNHTDATHVEYDPGRLPPPIKTCWCAAGYVGARCAHRSVIPRESGGATCNRSMEGGGGNASSCVRGRCVCGEGLLGAMCNFASASGRAGGAACQSSIECGGEPKTNGSHVTRNASGETTPVRPPTGGSCIRGRCVCEPGVLGARCLGSPATARPNRTHHRCLSTWRKELTEGVPLAFAPCLRTLHSYQAWVRPWADSQGRERTALPNRV
jgi:hypothetical protein